MYQKEPNNVIKILRSIWPYIYKALNNSIYFILSLIKTIVKESIRMIKTGGIGE